MKKLLFFVLLFGTSLVTIAQEPKKPEYRPDWVFNTPHPGNSTYLYVVEYGEAANKREALNQAMARVFQSTANRIGQFVSTEAINRAVQEGTNYEVIGRNMKVPVNKVCEFATQDKSNYHWTVYVLCQVAKSGSITPEFEYCDLCNTHTMFDSAIKRYNQQIEHKKQLKEQFDKQYAVDGWCYTLGASAITAGCLMQLGWAKDDDGIANNPKCGYAGLGIIGGGLIIVTIPSIVKIAFKAKSRKTENFYTSNPQSQKTQDMQLSLGFVPNGVGMICTF